MDEAYILGAASTAFERWPDRGFRDLAEEACLGALDDAGLDDGGALDGVWFGNCAMGAWGQSNIRGQVALGGLVREGRLPGRSPITNVEGGCATGSLAFAGAHAAVAAGTADVALAIGVEKTFVPDDPVKTFGLFGHGIDRLHEEEWRSFFDAQASEAGLTFQPHPHRILFLDVHALLARHHMQRHGTTVEQIATVAAKNHTHGALNPKAQYRIRMTPEQVLADKPVVAPLTRAMCAPVSDGAAAVVLCSSRWRADRPAEVRARAVRVRGLHIAGGTWRGLDEDSVSHHAARGAYAAAGLAPADVDVAELHDATAPCEILHTEAMGFCDPGQGGAYAASGATSLGGARPVNPSGGLASKGHPLGATGLGMLDELVAQLRGEAGERQVADARVGLAHNAGGLVGLDEALCAVTLLERP